MNKRPNRKPDITLLSVKNDDVYFWVTEVIDENNVKLLYAYDTILWGSDESSWAQIRNKTLFFCHSYEECKTPWSADSDMRASIVLEAVKLWIDKQVEEPLIGEGND